MKDSVKRFYEIVATEEEGNYNPASGRLTSLAAATQHHILVAVSNFIRRLNVSLVLDVGSGPGRYLGVYERNEAFHIMVDGIRPMLLLAKKRAKSAGSLGSADFIVADMEKLPIRSSSCDFVSCFDVLHHLESQEKKSAVGELARVATEAGYVFLEIKNKMFLHYMIGISRRNPTGVSKASSYFSIRAFFQDSGFREVYSVGAWPWGLAPKVVSPSILMGFRRRVLGKNS